MTAGLAPKREALELDGQAWERLLTHSFDAQLGTALSGSSMGEEVVQRRSCSGNPADAEKTDWLLVSQSFALARLCSVRSDGRMLIVCIHALSGDLCIC